MSKNSFFDSDYISDEGTSKSVSSFETKDESEELLIEREKEEQDIEKYGVAKPKREIIKVKITDD